MSERSVPNRRRAFLKSLAIAGGGAAAAGLAGRAQATAAPAAPAPAPSDTSQGYRLTAHIRNYYEKARF